MKRGSLVVLASCAAALVLACQASCAGEDRRSSDEFRKEFLARFPKNGLCTTPEDARLLRVLIEARRAQRGVEVGSYTGFGAIHMGIGFERTGGRLDTIEIDPATARKCRENVKAVGLEKTVTVIEGDALQVLPKLEGEVDFVFIDALKQDYFKYFKAIEPRLKPGAVIVADNTIAYASAMRDFLDFMRNSPDYEAVTVRASDAKHDGMTVCIKVRQGREK